MTQAFPEFPQEQCGALRCSIGDLSVHTASAKGSWRNRFPSGPTDLESSGHASHAARPSLDQARALTKRGAVDIAVANILTLCRWSPCNGFLAQLLGWTYIPTVRRSSEILRSRVEEPRESHYSPGSAATWRLQLQSRKIDTSAKRTRKRTATEPAEVWSHRLGFCILGVTIIRSHPRQAVAVLPQGRK